MDTFSTERLVPNSSGDDDSDGDLVTDFLSSEGNNTTVLPVVAVAVAAAATTICTNPFLSNYDEQQFNTTISNNLNNSSNLSNNSNSKSSSNNNCKQPQQNPSGILTTSKTANNRCLSGATNAPQQLQNLFQSNQPQQQQQQQQKPSQQIHPNFQNIPLINVPAPSVNTQINMVPIISVTPHSPGTKYSSILEDSLCHLQNIRESVVQMKNSVVPMRGFVASSLVQTAVLSSSRLFSSCPSLSDLSANSLNCSIFSPQQPFFNSDRRKSWTGIEDLTECSQNTKTKSVSLSSIDSEEQESIRVAERHRASRNSTGGISTHSLNEAELARDFERIAAKRNLAPTLISRIPLQKSISTPSIAPLRIPGAKEETTIPTTRHLSDSEDDQQDDRSLLCVRDKNEVYADHPEKRRKRGSLFFRKKKDKTKTKGQSTNCDACGATINLATVKDHAAECKAKTTKLSKSGSGKNKSSTSHTSHHDDSRDYYDGHNDNSNYSDDTPLIRVEFLNEPPIGPHDLGADAALGIALDEHDSWSPSVPKEIVKSLKDKQQVKRQEHIYEFIMTEKHHCQTLLVMQKIFVESIQRHFSRLNIERLFPRLTELTELHTTFLKKLRQKQRECPIVDSIADIILDFLSAASAQRLKSAYGEFCSNHRSALEKFKYYTSDQTFAEWYKHCLSNPLLKKKGIPECILFVTQRMTKYPLLIDPLLKSSREDRMEQEKLQRSMALVKSILVDVDARVAEKEKQDRQLEIFKNIDVKSSTMFKNKLFKKADVVDTNRRLKFEGYATLMQGRSKMQNVMVVVLSDCLLFLQENSHNKYTFFTPENKAGVISLQKLLIREKAGTESRGIYIISSNPAYPEMYELKVQNPKDKNQWIQAIRAAVLECPTDDMEHDDLTAEEKQRLIDEKQATMRELIYKMRQKDIEQALLLEEKILLQLALIKDKKNIPENAAPKAEEFLSNFGSYKDLITDDCDTVEIWKRVLNTVQEISQLAATLYTAATGLPVSRSVSSVGEKQSDTYASPTLPKRAETFGGFDDRRVNKTNIPWRDAVLSTLPISTLPSSKDNQFLNSNTTTPSSTSGSNVLQLHSEYDKNLNALTVAQQNQTAQQISLRDNNFAALQVSHHLHTLLCIISQQMTTIHNLQAQLANFRDNPKTIYKHNDQLEELRNLQDKLQEEKQAWQKEKDHQEKDLEEQRLAQEAMQKQIKAEQEDIKQQREQLYRKMEMLSNQGLLMSPNTPIPMPMPHPNDDGINHQNADDLHSTPSGHSVADGVSSSEKPKKEKWRSTSMSKAPPANLLSAKNAPKVNEASIKQQIPMKLSSLSSTKTDKAPNSSNNITSPPNNSSGGITQMFPLKLADKKNQNMTPNHARTGSSPAIIQQPPQQSGNPATRTNTYPKLPDRYRLRNSDVGLSTATTASGVINTVLASQIKQQQNNMNQAAAPPHPPRNPSLYSQLGAAVTTATIATATPSAGIMTTRQLQNLSSLLINQQQQQQQQKQSHLHQLQTSLCNNPTATAAYNHNNQTINATASHQLQQSQQPDNNVKTKPITPEEEEIYF